MKIAIFGATGSLGRHVVEQALERGYEVTVLTRDAGRATWTNPRLHVVEGDVSDPAAVERTVAGQDAVLVTLGNGRKGVVRAEGTRQVIAAMERNRVKRLICQSTLGAGDSRGSLDFLWKHIMFGLLLRPALADHEQQEKYVRASTLDWTIVRPSAFTDGPRTGDYRHGFGPEERNLTLKISRADIAEFLLDQITDRNYLHRTPGISN